MSYGKVICTVCFRECGRSGTGRDGKQIPRWFHIDDTSDICPGGDVKYADMPEPVMMKSYYLEAEVTE